MLDVPAAPSVGKPPPLRPTKRTLNQRPKAPSKRPKRRIRSQKARNFFYKLHRYAGLLAALVFFISAATGTILVFEDEIEHAFYPERYSVEQEGEALSIEQSLSAVKQAFPDARVSSALLFADPSRTYRIGFRDDEDTFHYAYVNPYSGALIETIEPRNTFFSVVLRLHRYLLAGKTGKLIVGVCTVLVLSLMFTGLYLWWPRTKAILSKRLRVQWQDANWKRRSYDLHVVLGFYTMWLLIITAATGLVWSFDVVEDSIYWITGSERGAPRPTSTVVEDGSPIDFDMALATVQTLMPHATRISLSISSRPDGIVSAFIQHAETPHESASDRVYLDKYTGVHLRTDLHEEASQGVKVRRLVYPIHVGSIFGLPSKIVVFIVCLIGATFPITGVYIWYIKWRKRYRAKRVRTQAAKA